MITRTMRAFGWLFTPTAIIMWVLTLAGIATYLFVPAARTQAMPFYGGTVHQFLRDIAIPAIIVLMLSNVLSGRWGPDALRRGDLTSSRLGFWGLLFFCILSLGFGVGQELEKAEVWGLLGIMAFAVVDLFYNQGEDWRSTSLKQGSGFFAGSSPAASAAGAGTATGSALRSPGFGPLAPYVSLGLTTLEIPAGERVMLEVDPSGGFEIVLPDMNLSRLHQLATAKVGTPPTP